MKGKKNQKDTMLHEGEDPNDFTAGVPVPEPVTEPVAEVPRDTVPEGAAKPTVFHEHIYNPKTGTGEAVPVARMEEPKEEPAPKVNPAIGDGGVLLSQTFQEEWKIASMMAHSEMVPDAFRGKPAAVMMAMQTARSRGLNPLTAIQQMANIFGRTIGFGELPLAEAFESKKLKFFQEFWIDAEGEEIDPRDIKTPVYGCVTVAEAHDSPQGKVVRIFTIEDAKNAGLLDDPRRKTWRQYTKRMLQMRSRGWALKDCVPSVTAGTDMPGYDEHAPETELPKSGTLADRLNAGLLENKGDQAALQN